MAHYAFLDNNNIVTEVITGKDETEILDGLTPEEWYGNYRGQRCVRTSYNNKIRKQYARIGDTYSDEFDAFIRPQPYPSWTLVESLDWAPPVEYPKDGKLYIWDDSTLSWDEVTE